MKTLVAGLLALTLAVFLALEVRNDNGYVLLGYGEWTVLEHHAYIQNGAIDLQLPWGKLRAIMPVNE